MLVDIYYQTPDETLARFIARLVANVYSQTYGMDYKDTLLLEKKIASVELFIFTCN